MNNKKYRTAIFDLDGTLLYTLEDLKDSINFMLEKNNFPQRSLEEIRRFVGNGIKKLVERSLPYEVDENEFQKYLNEFKAHYSVNSRNKTKPYDGITEILSALKKNGIKTAVISNKVDSQTKLLCNEIFGGYFDYCAGQLENVPVKPSPDGVWKAVEELNCEKYEAVYIGDSEVDFKTAENSGMDFIGVSWGFRGRELLQSLGTKNIVDSPSELLDYFTIK